jgi:dTDP-4-amino-4,6-dideoxygalactose transaminase
MLDKITIMNKEKPIFVTQPALPPLDEFIPYLKKIWDNKILTNNGPLHKEFEKKVCQYLKTDYISLFCNGTIALITAIQALNLSGEVITTPFSFVATTHSLWWNNIKPVFVDIEPDFFNIDADKIEAAITPKTTGILPVHVYGNPCDVVKIDKIAKKYNLKVLYDTAHTFGNKINNKSILDYGDLSILSFHTTKVYNTFEGGAIVSHTEEMKDRIDKLKNFGFAGETSVIMPGINGKMNEFQAAMGLLQLKYIDKYIKKRKMIVQRYKEVLKNINGITIIAEPKDSELSYTYFPVLIDKEKYGISRDDLYNKYKKHNINTRRYFYPLISHFEPYNKLKSAKKENLPVAEKTASEIICLPLYPDLSEADIEKIITIASQSKR